ASTGFAVFRPRGTHPGFLGYALLNDQFLHEVVARSVGVSYPAISASALASVSIYVPDLETQALIADYLDRETAEIDAFIADQEELIALLTERRAATIAQAVTKGLDSTSSMKPIGIEWLGAVPASWRVSRLSRFFAVTLGKMLDAKQQTEAQFP